LGPTRPTPRTLTGVSFAERKRSHALTARLPQSAAVRAACIDLGKAGKAGAIPHSIGIRVVIDGLDLSWTHPLNMRSGIRGRCGERDKQNGSCKREERCGTSESHDDLLGSRSRFIRTSARVDRRVPEVIPWISMSNYFEALVFGHALSQDSFSYRAIRAADVRAIVIISCAAYPFRQRTRPCQHQSGN
jgi:hypothetical protein